MRKMVLGTVLTLFCASLVGCSSSNNENKTADSQVSTEETKETGTEKKITYLSESYEVVYPTDKIITASLESMEDAVALDVTPIGVVTVGNEVPAYLKKELGSIDTVGTKFEPSFEKALALRPDVILGSTKFDEDVTSGLAKVAPTINVSHKSDDWSDNLRLLGELSGKSDLAEKKIETYEKNLKEIKNEQKDISEKEVLLIRIRSGELAIYSPSVYFNPMLYNDLGFKVPEIVAKAEVQSVVSVEQLAKVTSDIILVQFDELENKDNPNALEELKENAVWQTIPAVSKGQVYYNIVEPGYQGGTYLSKEVMLKELQETIFK